MLRHAFGTMWLRGKWERGGGRDGLVIIPPLASTQTDAAKPWSTCTPLPSLASLMYPLHSLELTHQFPHLDKPNGDNSPLLPSAERAREASELSMLHCTLPFPPEPTRPPYPLLPSMARRGDHLW
jgi:hypothetical protein